MLWWILGAGLLLIVLFIGTRARRYNRIFAAPHLLEIAARASSLRDAALARLVRTDEDLAASFDDPRIFRTSADMIVVYTVRPEDSRFIHHWSVSIAGGVTPHAVGGPFAVYVAKLLGLPLDRAAFEVGLSSVHHGQIALDENQHDELARRPVPTPTASGVRALYADCHRAARTLTWQHAQ